MKLSSRKMGMHEWWYKNDYNPAERRMMPHVDLKERFKKLNIEVELGFTAEQAVAEVQRCLNCDVQTVFTAKAVHRVRRLHRHLPDRLLDDHAERHRGRAAPSG